MTLKEIISEQLRLGNGLKVGGDNILLRAVGREEAQISADAPLLASLERAVLDAKAVVKASEDAQSALKIRKRPASVAAPSPEDPENLTAEDVKAQDTFDAYKLDLKLFNIYERKIQSLKTASEKANDKAEQAEESAIKIKAAQVNIGQTDQLERNPTEVMIKDLLKFISKKAGRKACLACEKVLRDYIAANPTATFVKVHKFEDSPAMICTADGFTVVRVDFSVKAG